jgi:hypothetical protein
VEDVLQEHSSAQQAPPVAAAAAAAQAVVSSDARQRDQDKRQQQQQQQQQAVAAAAAPKPASRYMRHVSTYPAAAAAAQASLQQHRRQQQQQQQQQQLQPSPAHYNEARGWLLNAGLLRPNESGRLDSLSAGLWLQWQGVLRCYAAGQGNQAMALAYRLGAATGALMNTCSSSGPQQQAGVPANGAAAGAGMPR